MAHRHAVKTTRTFAYSSPVGPPEEQDQRAHGGVRHVDTCSCGAERKTNSNGRFVETTGWYMPDDLELSPAPRS